MPFFYRSGNVLVSIPDSDGTPMSMLEGMSCGCLPVVSDLPSIREWIIDGENGYLVPADATPEDLAAAIEKAIQRAREDNQVLAKNRAIVTERASQHSNMAEMQGLYDKLVA